MQTAIGSAKMLRDSGEHPVQLREAVTSPGGTTIAAIRELEVHGVRAALLAAIEAARDRAAQSPRDPDLHPQRPPAPHNPIAAVAEARTGEVTSRQRAEPAANTDSTYAGSPASSA